MTKLRNRTVLLTCCSSALGYSFAVQLARKGANLVLWDTDARSSQRVAGEITRLYGVTAAVYQVDLREKEQVYAAARRLAVDGVNVSVVVNSIDALGEQQGKLLVEKDGAQVANLLELHALGSLWLIKALLPAMFDGKQGGHFVFLSSSAPLMGCTSGIVDYAASKYVLLGMTRSLQHELKRLESSPTTTNKPGIQLTTVLAPLEYSKLAATQPSNAVGAKKVERGWMQSDLIAMKTIDAIKRNKCELLLPGEFRFVHALCALLPQTWGDKLLDQLKYSRASSGLNLHDSLAGEPCAQSALSPQHSHFAFSFAAATTGLRQSIRSSSQHADLAHQAQRQRRHNLQLQDGLSPDKKWRLHSILSGIGLGDCCFATVIPCGSAALIAQGIDNSPVVYGAFFAAAFLGDVLCVLFATSADSGYSSATFPGSAQDTTNYEQLTLIVVAALLTSTLFAGVRALRRAFCAFHEIRDAPLLEELCMSTCYCWCTMTQMSTYVKPQVSSGDMLPVFIVAAALV